MFRFFVSLFLGMLPEVLYFTFFLIYTKDLKEKKLKLFFGIMIVYILCIMISLYKLLYYVVFIFLIYIVLKILYKQKAQIIDIFVFSIATLYLTLTSYICYQLMNNNILSSFVCYLMSRIFLIIPFIFKNRFNYLYKLYCGLWNRNDKEKRPIKSITLRNVSVIIINLLIFFINIGIIIKTS